MGYCDSFKKPNEDDDRQKSIDSYKDCTDDELIETIKKSGYDFNNDSEFDRKIKNICECKFSLSEKQRWCLVFFIVDDL